MNGFMITAMGCLALGMMTTTHPCPLAANIGAISLITGSSRNKKRLFSVVLLFGLGQMVALSGVAVLLSLSLVSMPRLSLYLQGVFSAFLGPLLILVGMVFSEMINLSRLYKGWLPKKEFWTKKPAIYIFLLGALMALAFCPATAFIFFGVLVPLSADHSQVVLFPLLFAVGALVPIATAGILIHYGAIAFLKEKWIGKIPLIAGWALIAVGVYITMERLYF
ncbi:MAG: sulfite exporter TauE/SafE family protein [Cyclobacteriaceae bacterium]|nr:sulfite exporter TauE/SafE family protein [Cyclobacteriaceae bacterium]